MALTETAKTLITAGVITAVVFVFIIVIVVLVKRSVSASSTGSAGAALASKPGREGDMLLDARVPPLPVQEPVIEGESVRIVPRDTLLKVEYWSDRWRFNQPDNGHVSFLVNKHSGLVVTLSDQPGYPKAGYSFIIDARGGHTTNFADTTTSTTYLARLPQMEVPASNSALVRNVELANVPRRVDVFYRHGIAELWVDGVMAIMYNDPFPVSNISYVGFGTMGLKSGEGLITDLVID